MQQNEGHDSPEENALDDVYGEPFEGLTLSIDSTNGAVVGMSTKEARYNSRWQSVPPLDLFAASVKELDLQKSTKLESADAICSLIGLQSLRLTRCTSLRKLPTRIGDLTNLVEVRKPKSRNMRSH